MKKFLKVILIASLFSVAVPRVWAQGWEENYEGVMLQGFYWDSFSDTKWTNLTSQANELSAYFDLIWIPNSCTSSNYTSMGYDPVYWFKHECSFGTSGELRHMINTFKKKGTGFIADVVVNHRNGVSNWTDFPTETDHKGNTWSWGPWAICQNDEVAWESGQATPTGAYDTGENFDGCRDLDHTNSYVQDGIKAYLDYLLRDLGYVGFRYDMVKGFSSWYVGLYNNSSNPTYSVGEYFDGNYDLVTGWIDGTKWDNKIQSAAFDFPLKYKMNTAFAPYSNAYNELAWWNADLNSNQPAGLLHQEGFRRFSVTFIDNHDTYRDGSKFTNDGYVVAANAFILCHPGTPCVFLRHWLDHKDAIKRLIDIRKSVGVHNQSKVEVWEAQTSFYAAKVYGKNGDLIIKVGPGDYSPYGYSDSDIVASGDGYCVWTKTSIESGADKIIPDNDHNGFAVYVKKSTMPTSWNELYCYAWDADENHLTRTFPGEEVTKIVTIGGEEYYKFSFDATTTTANVVLSNGDGSQTVDLENIKDDVYYSFSSTNSEGKYTMSALTVSGAETGEPITIYLEKSSVPADWGTVKYYAWDNNGTLLLGNWSGTAVSTISTFNGVDYYTYTFPNTVTMTNVIFTDGSKQTLDVKGVTETSYFAIGGVVDGKYAVEKVKVSDAQGISVYLEKNAIAESWGAVYYYAWNEDESPITDFWPGTKVEQTATVNGVEYYKYTFDSSISSFDLIFTNGVNQTADLTNITDDVYYSLQSESGEISEIADPENYTGSSSASEPISVYLKKNDVVSSWSSVNFYAWNDDINPMTKSWPGTNMKSTETVTIGGSDFYVYTFPADVEKLNIIFNNGSGQTADINNITKTTYFEVNSDFSFKKNDEPITVFLEMGSVEDAGWNSVNYYAWDGSGKILLDSWPGTEVTHSMQAKDGKYYFFHTFDPVLTQFNIIFNSGGNGSNQTEDITVSGTTFYSLGSVGSSGKRTVTTTSTYVPTDIEEVVETRTECVIYPNPVTTDFVVRSSVDVDCVRVYDLNGAIVRYVQGNLVDVRDLVDGVYLYCVELSNGTVERGKFIKR